MLDCAVWSAYLILCIAESRLPPSLNDGEEEEEKINALCKEFRSFHPAAATHLNSGLIYLHMKRIKHITQYRGGNKGLYVLLSRTQAEQLSKSRNKFLATTYKPLFPPL